MANNAPKSKKNNGFRKIPLGWILAFIVFLLFINSLNLTPISGLAKEISYSEFYRTLKNNPQNIKSLVKFENELQGEFKEDRKSVV